MSRDSDRWIEWGGRRLLDLIGCTFLSVGYAYLCGIAPLAIIPIVSLLTLPLALAGLPLVPLGLFFLAGFDRGSRRSVEGFVGTGLAGLLVVGATLLAFGEIADPRLLRKMFDGAPFPWMRLDAAAALSVIGGTVAAASLYRSRHLRAWAPTAVGAIVATLPIAVARSLAYFVVLYQIPYTA